MTPDYQLLRSARRKTLAIQVRDGQVVVRAPISATRAAIEGFVQSKADWIGLHRQRQQREIEQLGVQVRQGGSVPWRGQMLELYWQRGEASGVRQTTDGFQVTLSSRVRRDECQVVTEQLQRWFQEQAEACLPARTQALAVRTGLQPSSTSIGSWRGRWGQCSRSGEVKLNWRLLQLAPALQDYVIVHELCHLRYMHHGPEFHELLQHHCPEHPRLNTEMRRFTPWLTW
ncbi:M48 family metallopeptidase [Marinobacterium marinum]|uniref:M48 family metallopeptidase n=1 Tax=Marinobacterium marinum TaxID=2756129 RepID=A0A7W2AAN3_9GAMM|nr:SprT family zinc-dependent metalloprotease [Marinobacterium marinum]MBA4502061.1 M48 family metallopeptidase [Marinobacterium marinum]